MPRSLQLATPQKSSWMQCTRTSLRVHGKSRKTSDEMGQIELRTDGFDECGAEQKED
jgi:hypothetical protein